MINYKCFTMIQPKLFNRNKKLGLEFNWSLLSSSPSYMNLLIIQFLQLWSLNPLKFAKFTKHSFSILNQLNLPFIIFRLKTYLHLYSTRCSTSRKTQTPGTYQRSLVRRDGRGPQALTLGMPGRKVSIKTEIAHPQAKAYAWVTLIFG